MSLDLDETVQNSMLLRGLPPSAFQTALGFTPENVANKSVDLTLANGGSPSDTLYPSQKVVATLARALDKSIRGYGYTNNATDPTNDINFGAGEARDSTGLYTIIQPSTLIKQLDAAWAAGTNQGGRMSAAAIANTTYFLFVIYNPSSGAVDAGFDVSSSAPTLPSGYTHFRRTGAILREGGVIVPFVTANIGIALRRVLRVTPISSYNTANPGTAQVLVTLHVPIGIGVQALVAAHLVDATPAAATNMLIGAPGQADVAPSATVCDLGIEAAGATVPQRASSNVQRGTNSSGQIFFRLDASDADRTVRFVTNGWDDPL